MDYVSTESSIQTYFFKYVFEQIVNLVNRLLKANFKIKKHKNNFHS